MGDKPRGAEWVAVALDGGLAHAGDSCSLIGAPAAPVIALVKRILAAGVEVRVITWRAADDLQRVGARSWLDRQGLAQCPLTDAVDGYMRFFIGAVAVPVDLLTGGMGMDEEAAAALLRGLLGGAKPAVGGRAIMEFF